MILNEIWLEKYRPQNLDGIRGNSEVLKALKNMTTNNNLLNLILMGPPGCGKTSAANSIAR